MTDVIIIGAGCAGLTAAIYAQRAGLSTILLEENFYGGQIAISNEIEIIPPSPASQGRNSPSKFTRRQNRLARKFTLKPSHRQSFPPTPR